MYLEQDIKYNHATEVDLLLQNVMIIVCSDSLDISNLGRRDYDKQDRLTFKFRWFPGKTKYERKFKFPATLMQKLTSLD